LPAHAADFTGRLVVLRTYVAYVTHIEVEASSLASALGKLATQDPSVATGVCLPLVLQVRELPFMTGPAFDDHMHCWSLRVEWCYNLTSMARFIFVFVCCYSRSRKMIGRRRQQPRLPRPPKLSRIYWTSRQYVTPLFSYSFQIPLLGTVTPSCVPSASGLGYLPSTLCACSSWINHQHCSKSNWVMSLKLGSQF
jgi:hypothetical protein